MTEDKEERLKGIEGGQRRNSVAELSEYGFVRVNIGFIINCKYIKTLKTKKIILCNGMEISIGSNRHDKVRHAYMVYVREKNKWKL